MTDGRKHQPARATLTVALTLSLTGAGIAAAAPATAAPDDLASRVDRARAEVDRLSGPAEARRLSHDRARDRAATLRARVESLGERLADSRERGTSLRVQMAREVLVENTSSGGSTATVGAEALAPESAQMLANVMVVTEDTDGRAQELTGALVTAQQIRERRADVRTTLREQRTVTARTGRQAQRATSALSSAKATAADLQAELDALRAERQAARQAEREAERQAEREAEEQTQAPSQPAEVASGSAVSYALAQVGKSYVWGASGPDSFDCSGLTSAAWATQGVSLPRTSSAQYAAGTPVSESELQPGDLVFYYSPISHVGMYVGNGQVVNALNPSSGVQVTGLHDMPYSGAVRPG